MYSLVTNFKIYRYYMSTKFSLSTIFWTDTSMYFLWLQNMKYLNCCLQYMKYFQALDLRYFGSQKNFNYAYPHHTLPGRNSLLCKWKTWKFKRHNQCHNESVYENKMSHFLIWWYYSTSLPENVRLVRYYQRALSFYVQSDPTLLWDPIYLCQHQFPSTFPITLTNKLLQFYWPQSFQNLFLRPFFCLLSS